MKDLYYKLYRINKDKTESLIMESPAIERLKIEIDVHNENIKLKNALENINDTAPPMYKYNDIELKMIMITRRALKDIE